MKRIKFNIANRISLGYIVVIAVALITSSICIVYLQSNKNIDEEISKVHLPVMSVTKELKAIISESRKLTNNWIYLPSNQEKNALKILIEEQFPIVEVKIDSIIKNELVDDSTRAYIKKDLDNFGLIMSSEKKVMNLLKDDDAYGSDSIVDLAIKEYDNEIKSKALNIEGGISKFLIKKNLYLEKIQQSKEQSYSLLSIMMVLTVIIILIVGILSSYFSTKSITKPLDELKKIILALSTGEMVKVDNKLNSRQDEVGEMSNAIDSMIKSLVIKTEFADKIGNGHYETEFHMLSDKDKMGSALIEMCNNLKKNHEENRKRSWSTTGMAQIGDILRKTNISSAELYDNVIKYIVKYTNSNQAGLFILNQETENELELVACYAYERKKYIDKTVIIGEGLVGQCVLEKDKIYITDVPRNYIEVTSGLGAATPRCLLIVPLKLNDVVHGVLEIASFSLYDEYEIEFIEKIAESIASIVSTMKINNKTKMLLQDSQEQSEQLRSQEEEMRQNLEELQATQEEIQRKEVTYIQEIEMLKKKLQEYEK